MHTGARERQKQGAAERGGSAVGKECRLSLLSGADELYPVLRLLMRPGPLQRASVAALR